MPVRRVIGELDVALYRALRVPNLPSIAHTWIVRYSRLGEHAAVWLTIGAAGAALDARRRGRWQRATGVVGGAYLLNTVLKMTVGRARPLFEDLPAMIATPTQLSFPSAHATSSFAAARAFSATGLLPAPPLYTAASLMALSRVNLGVHFPTDIAAGAALGTLLGGAAR